MAKIGVAMYQLYNTPQSAGRLSLLHIVVQVECNLGADILQQYGNFGHAGQPSSKISR
jgi:hypothetical protein